MGSLSLATATKARHWLPTYRRIAADAQYNRQSHHRIAGAIIDRQPWPSSSAKYDAAWSRATDTGRQHLRSISSLRGRRRRRSKHDAAPTICIAHGLCWRSGLAALDADAVPAHTKSPTTMPTPHVVDASRRPKQVERRASTRPCWLHLEARDVHSNTPSSNFELNPWFWWLSSASVYRGCVRLPGRLYAVAVVLPNIFGP